MRFPPTAWVAVLALASAASVAATDDPNYDPSYNFRPDNVTLNVLYNWVGSYYNGTTRVEFWPYTGLAAFNSSLCPAFRNETIIREYPSVLGLTEPSIYNTANDPLNSMLTLWPPGFNLSTLPPTGGSEEILDMKSLQSWLWSSTPVYQSTFTMSETPEELNYFEWSIQDTQDPTFNLSSTLIEDGSMAGFEFNMTSCNGTGEVLWSLGPLYWNASYNGVVYPYPTIGLQFDSQSANVSLEGYLAGARLIDQDGIQFQGMSILVGKFRLTFLGTIDIYHSDVLENNTATPTWLRTVGFQNNSLNVGYTSESTGNQLIGSLSLAALAFILLKVALFMS